MKKTITTLSVLCFLFLGIFWSQTIVWRPIEQNFYELGRNPGFVPTGDQLRPVLFGFDHFAADLFWIRAVQYSGSNALSYSFDALPAYVNLVVDLDPHFLFPYHFAALVLPLNASVIDSVTPLLEKGIAHNPNSSEILLDLAFFEYYYLNDIDSAIAHYDQCVRDIPDCPPSARKVAANLRAKKGKYEISLQIWLEKLSEPNLPQQESELALKKIEESAKLVALNCAFSENPNAQELSDFVGIDTTKCTPFQSFSPDLLSWLAPYDLFRITKNTITSPFPNNTFEIKDGRVGARFW